MLYVAKFLVSFKKFRIFSSLTAMCALILVLNPTHSVAAGTLDPNCDEACMGLVAEQLADLEIAIKGMKASGGNAGWTPVAKNIAENCAAGNCDVAQWNKNVCHVVKWYGEQTLAYKEEAGVNFVKISEAYGSGAGGCIYQ